MTAFNLYLLTLKAYRYYKKNPISIRNRIYTPHYPFYLKDNNYIYIVVLIMRYIISRYDETFLKTMKMSYKLTTNFNDYLPHFVSKKIIFHRSNKEKWFNQNFHQEEAYEKFIQHLEMIIKKDVGLMRML